ncbi:MAG: radical SAM protein [Oligoflexia bacterium]|nr:radical SAM protein [Oligoflexia bacterium]
MFNKALADKFIRSYGDLCKGVRLSKPRPLLYYFYLTKKCNLNCSYCWQRSTALADDKGTVPSHELSADEWCQVIEKIKRPAVIGFSGGEPLLFSGFKKIFTTAAKRFKVTINSNGLLLSEELSELLVQHKLRNLSISLDGFASVHDLSRNSAGSFDKICRNIEFFNRCKNNSQSKTTSLTIKLTLIDEFIDQLDDFVGFCKHQLQAETVNISFAKSEHHAQFSHRLYSSLSNLSSAGLPRSEPYKHPKKIADLMMSIKKKYTSKDFHLTLYPAAESGPKIEKYLAHQMPPLDIYHPCSIPWSLITFMPGGDVIPCLSLKIGNVRDHNYDIKKILGNQQHQEFLNQMRNNKTPPICNCCCFLSVKA